MQGQNDTQQQLFHTVELDSFIPNSHLLKKVNRLIDFNFIYDLTKPLYCDNNGRPSVDSVLFFRMQLIGYLYNIQSDRRLCEEIHLNIAYRWFCGLNLDDKIPNHSSITRIRDRFGTGTYEKIFNTLLDQWRSQGIVKGKRVISDASMVEANAAMDSLVERDNDDPDLTPLKRYQHRYHDFKEGKRQRKVSNQTHVSYTDPDATMVSHKNLHKKLQYKVHYTIDAQSRMILDCYGTTGSKHECNVLPERVDYLVKQRDFSIEEIIADKGYGRGPSYTAFREYGIRNYIPLHDDNLGQGKLSRGNFKYDRRNDRYRCPKGHYLYPYDKLEKNLLKRYRVTGGHCLQCPLRDSCLPNNMQHRARFVYRSPHQDEIDKVRKRQSTPTFKKRLTERKWKVEGLFGEAKENHCLRRVKYRGLAKAQIQFFMIALAQNVKRRVINGKKYFTLQGIIQLPTHIIELAPKAILETISKESLLSREKESAALVA